MSALWFVVIDASGTRLYNPEGDLFLEATSG